MLLEVHSTDVLVNVDGMIMFSGQHSVDGRKVLLGTFFAGAILLGPGWKELSALILNILLNLISIL